MQYFADIWTSATLTDGIVYVTVLKKQKQMVKFTSFIITIADLSTGWVLFTKSKEKGGRGEKGNFIYDAENECIIEE